MRRKKAKNLGSLEGKPINDLIVFAIFKIESRGEKCTFARLVKECFTLFPGSFKLAGYAKWPDTRKLDRPLRALRDKKLISGSPKSSFSLTAQGKKIAQDIVKNLRQKKLL